MNVPPETPVRVWAFCVSQVMGVVQVTSVQDRPDAGSGPSSGSVACPLNEIASPTAYVSVDAGVSITGVGGVFGAAGANVAVYVVAVAGAVTSCVAAPPSDQLEKRTSSPIAAAASARRAS